MMFSDVVFSTLTSASKWLLTLSCSDLCWSLQAADGTKQGLLGVLFSSSNTSLYHQPF
jgi:hypothetical protein